MRNNKSSAVKLRKFPFPYKAALAICSDIDETKTIGNFLEIQRFLNTKQTTAIDKGIGLEIGNSLFMYSNNNQFSYFSSQQNDRRIIKELIRSGYIDCIHSYGEKKDFSREDGLFALQELKENNCSLKVWIDHANVKNNLGSFRKNGMGDIVHSKIYHADLTLSFGVKFGWFGALTPVIGQSATKKFGLRTVWNKHYSLLSLRMFLREFCKKMLGLLEHRTCAIYAKNELVRPRTLADGNRIYEFVRFDNNPLFLGGNADAKGLSESISSKVLQTLKKREAYIIVYTHLGKNRSNSCLIPQETQAVLRNLASEYKIGNIYVTTTSKLLNYYVVCKYLNWSYEIDNGIVRINIQDVRDPVFGPSTPSISDLQGVTFYIPPATEIGLFIRNKRVTNIQINPVDYTGRPSLTIPLKPLKFPEL